MWQVRGIRKGTTKEIMVEDQLTEKQAEKFCEEWGWSYDDGEHSYWLKMIEIAAE